MQAEPESEWPVLVAVSGTRSFKIVADRPEIGWYLYVFEGTKCTHDYLQDTEEKAKECARDLFCVPMISWTTKAKGENA